MAVAETNQEIFFDDPRLRMTIAGRLFVRVIFYASFLVFGSLVLALFISEYRRGFWLGVLLALFLIDILLHFNNGSESLFYFPKVGRYNAADALATRSFGAIEWAMDRSLISGKDFRFLLVQKLLAKRQIAEVLARLEIKEEDFLAALARELGKNPQKDKKTILDFLGRLAPLALKKSLRDQSRYIEPADLFAVLPELKDQSLDKVFGMFSIEVADFDIAVVFSRFRNGWLRRFWRLTETRGHYSYRMRRRVMNRAWTARPTPTLDRFSVDFTALAGGQGLGFLIGHEEVYGRVVDVLSRREKSSVLLVGEPGAGKETIVGHLAFKINKDEVPAELFDRRLVELNVERLVAGAAPEELQARAEKIVEEIEKAGNIILYIPNIDKLSRTSGAVYLSAADALLPAFERGLFPIIGTVYPREYKKFVEPSTEFNSAFEVVRVEEVSETEAMKILAYLSLGMEAERGVVITLGSIKQAVKLARKYFRQKLLPGGAEDLLSEALSQVVRSGGEILNTEAVIKVAEQKVNVPIREVEGEEAAELLNLETVIHDRLVDQEEAVRAVSRVFREYRSGLKRKGGPIAAFLFVGPTGVGKTELAKILSQIQFGSEKSMVRFDMSEYQDKQSIFRFIGSPDGAMTGVLTDAILEKPYSLVLLDEFEKANPNILNLFLQVFDDGRLTDNLSRTASFENAVIIATSNAHSEFIKEKLEQGESMEAIGEELKKKLTDYFKPELINRFSDIIVFKSLSKEDVEKIAGLQLRALAKDLLEAKSVSMTFDEGVAERVAELGFSEVFGARPLRNVISEKLRGPLSEAILKGEINKNDSMRIGIDNGEFKFYHLDET